MYRAGPGDGIEVMAPVSASRFVLPGLPGVHIDAGQFPGALRASIEVPVLMQVLGLSGKAAASPVQQALFAAISGLDQAGVRDYGVDPGLLPAPGSPADAAARRFAALPRPAEHAWLAAHIAALRAGRLTLADLP